MTHSNSLVRKKICQQFVNFEDFFENLFYKQAFELLHGWTGLLVEANPGIFPVGFLSGRKAWQVIALLLETIEIISIVIFVNTSTTNIRRVGLDDPRARRLHCASVVGRPIRSRLGVVVRGRGALERSGGGDD